MPGDNLSFYLLDGNQAGEAARLYCNLMADGRCLFGFVLIYLFIHSFTGRVFFSNRRSRQT